MEVKRKSIPCQPKVKVIYTHWNYEAFLKKKKKKLFVFGDSFTMKEVAKNMFEPLLSKPVQQRAVFDK